MTSDRVPRPRRSPDREWRAADLTVPVPGPSGLTEIAGGRPLTELVVLAGAVAWVFAAAEDADEAAFVVAGPAGPVRVTIAVSGLDVVRDLVLAADEAVRTAPVAEVTAGALVVSSTRVAAATARSPGGALSVALADGPGPDSRVVRLRVSEPLVDEWFATVLAEAVAEVLRGMAESRLPLVDLPVAAEAAARATEGFGRDPGVLPGAPADAVRVVVTGASGRPAALGYLGEIAVGAPAGTTPTGEWADRPRARFGRRSPDPTLTWWRTGERGWWWPDGSLRRAGAPTPPRPDPTGTGTGTTDTDVLARVTAILGEVLDDPHVGPDDNFFRLGGHSLLALETIGRVKEVIGVVVSLDAFLMAETVRDIATVVADARNGDQAEPSPVLGAAGDPDVVSSLLTPTDSDR